MKRRIAMREQSHSKQPFVTLLLTLLSVVFLTGLGNANGQSTNTSDLVSIQVDGGTIRQVLNAFAIQTKRNVVIGPDVTNDVVTIQKNGRSMIAAPAKRST